MRQTLADSSSLSTKGSTPSPLLGSSYMTGEVDARARGAGDERAPEASGVEESKSIGSTSSSS